VADRVKAELERIVAPDPAGGEVQVAYDSSTYVKQAIGEVQETMFIAFGLVLLIIFAFLRNFRSTIIPMLAVPVSLIGTFMVLNLWVTASTS
jgi:multidrug efflux pump